MTIKAKWQLSTLVAVAAGSASQTIPVKITHVFMLCCATQIHIGHTILISVWVLLHGVY